MTYYALDPINAKNKKPEVIEVLMKEALLINRSRNAFAGVPIDMALKQSILKC